MKLLVLNGWSAPRDAWQDALPLISGFTDICVLDLQLADGETSMFDAIDDYLHRIGNTPLLLIGWSLGGAVATRYLMSARSAALRARFKALCLLQSSPCFLQKEDWANGMPIDTFEAFAEFVSAADEQDFARQFSHMMLSGDASYRSDLRSLRRVFARNKGVSKVEQVAGLEALRTWDTRAYLKQLSMPVLHILGSEDSLVSAAAARELSGLGTQHNVRVIDGMAHVPFLSHVEQVAGAIEEFISKL